MLFDRDNVNHTTTVHLSMFAEDSYDLDQATYLGSLAITVPIGTPWEALWNIAWREYAKIIDSGVVRPYPTTQYNLFLYQA